MLSTIEEAIDDVRAGRLIIIVDDEDRENEGDLVCPAEKVTPEIINFMAREGRGLICLAMTEDRLVLTTVTLIALPVIGAALGNIPTVGAQLGAVCGNLALAIAGGLATTIAIRLYHMTMDGVTGMMGAAGGTPAAAR